MGKLRSIRDYLKKKLEDLTTKGIPKQDGSGEGKRKNKGRNGCKEEEQEKEGKGKKDMIINDFMTTDFQVINDSMLGGYVVRDGGFEYGKDEHGNPLVRYKDWDNLQDAYSKVDLVPAYGSKYQDSHYEADDRFIGFWDDFKFIPKGEPGVYHSEDKPDIDHKFNRVWGRLNTEEDITELSDLSIEDLKGLPVSASYEDLGRDQKQVVGKVYHIAVSLNKNERDRCSTLGGTSCNISPIGDLTNHDQNITGVSPTHDFDNSTTGVSRAPANSAEEPPENKKDGAKDMTKKKEEEPMEEEEKPEDDMEKEDMKTTKKGEAPPYEKEEKKELLKETEDEKAPKKKKDMALEEVITSLNDLRAENEALKAQINDMLPIINRKKEEYESEDAKDFKNLKETLSKEPYNVPEESLKEKDLLWLRDKKDFMDGLPMIQDFIKEQPLTHEDVNKHAFDFEMPNDPVTDSFLQAQRKFKIATDFGGNKD